MDTYTITTTRLSPHCASTTCLPFLDNRHGIFFLFSIRRTSIRQWLGFSLLTLNLWDAGSSPL